MHVAPLRLRERLAFRWNDPAFGIEWPQAAERTISERDLGWPDYTVSAGRRRNLGA